MSQMQNIPSLEVWFREQERYVLIFVFAFKFCEFGFVKCLCEYIFYKIGSDLNSSFYFVQSAFVPLVFDQLDQIAVTWNFLFKI